MKYQFHRTFSSSMGMGIFFAAANFFRASYLKIRASISSRMILLSCCIFSMSRYSCDFSDSNSSFCSIRLIRQLSTQRKHFEVNYRHTIGCKEAFKTCILYIRLPCSISSIFQRTSSLLHSYHFIFC